MGLFTAGLFTGVLACAVIMLVRCAAWYEVRHPEDDYWHRNILRLEADLSGAEQKTIEQEAKVQGLLSTEAIDEEGH